MAVVLGVFNSLLIGLEGTAVKPGAWDIQSFVPAELASEVVVVGFVFDGVVSTIVKNYKSQIRQS